MNELFSVQFAILISRPHTHLCACIVIMAIEMTQIFKFSSKLKILSICDSKSSQGQNEFILGKSHKVNRKSQSTI